MAVSTHEIPVGCWKWMGGNLQTVVVHACSMFAVWHIVTLHLSFDSIVWCAVSGGSCIQQLLSCFSFTIAFHIRHHRVTNLKSLKYGHKRWNFAHPSPLTRRDDLNCPTTLAVPPKCISLLSSLSKKKCLCEKKVILLHEVLSRNEFAATRCCLPSIPDPIPNEKTPSFPVCEPLLRERWKKKVDQYQIWSKSGDV